MELPMHKILGTLIILFSLGATAENSLIEQYISTALQNNLALKQQDFSYRRSVAALDEARGLFLPSIDINARYSWADGGRTIDIPVDEFLNPIYQTLNMLLQQNVFPENIESQTIRFLREKEHETKIRAVQPLFNADIY
jgi:hypothetical protein